MAADLRHRRGVDESMRRAKLIAFLNATVTMVRSDKPDLTDRQKAVLVKAYVDDRDQTVRGLAKYAQVSKPAITRALDRLAEFDLIRRKTDPLDRRSVIVQQTAAGRAYLREFGDILVLASDSVIEEP